MTQRQSLGVLLLRILLGWVFLSEGIQKFLFPAALGPGRFAHIGIPAPSLTAPFVGVFEIVCGALLILGLFTAFAAVPLLIDIIVAIATTKIPMLFKQGFWAATHEARTDFCMLLGLLAILCLGPGVYHSTRAVAAPRNRDFLCYPGRCYLRPERSILFRAHGFVLRHGFSRALKGWKSSGLYP